MTYPIVLQPSASVTDTFKLTAGRKIKKTGASELLAFSHVCKLGLEAIREDVGVMIAGHRYEPDLAYIDNVCGVYIAIEIDEPYSSNHHPTHYINRSGQHKDTHRNELFCRCGWYVVRFTERQMFCHTASCMRVVCELIAKAGGTLDILAEVRNAPALTPEDCWTADESVEWSYRDYRRSYLGYDPMNMDLAGTIKCCRLAVPVIFQAFSNSRVRRMLMKQLKNVFLFGKLGVETGRGRCRASDT